MLSTSQLQLREKTLRSQGATPAVRAARRRLGLSHRAHMTSVAPRHPPEPHPTTSSQLPTYSLALLLRQAASAAFLKPLRDAARQNMSTVPPVSSVPPEATARRVSGGGLSPNAVPFGLGTIHPFGHCCLPRQPWLLSTPGLNPGHARHPAHPR